MKTISVDSAQLTRRDAESVLIYPLKPLTSEGASRSDVKRLHNLFTQNPECLQGLGIARVDVYRPTCTDPVQGHWEVGRHSVWIDKETGIPLDAATVRIEERLPPTLGGMKRSELINLLPPTYFRHQVDAMMLAEVLQAAGPMGEWR